MGKFGATVEVVRQFVRGNLQFDFRTNVGAIVLFDKTVDHPEKQNCLYVLYVGFLDAVGQGFFVQLLQIENGFPVFQFGYEEIFQGFKPF